MKKNTKKAAILALALVGCLSVAGISAYLTDGDTTTNTFTVGRVSIDLQEPSWEPDDVTQITPEEEFAKDPQIKNDGINDAYVFAEVEVPYDYVTIAGEDGTKAAAKAWTEMFSYDVNAGWIELDAYEVIIDENGAVVDAANLEEDGTYWVKHLYAYGAADAMTVVAKDVTTGTLFDYVRFANIVEDENLEETSLDIVVNGYAIQTANINDNDADVDGVNDDGKVAPSDVWDVLAAQAPTVDVTETEDAKTDVKG